MNKEFKELILIVSKEVTEHSKKAVKKNQINVYTNASKVQDLVLKKRKRTMLHNSDIQLDEDTVVSICSSQKMKHFARQ